MVAATVAPKRPRGRPPRPKTVNGETPLVARAPQVEPVDLHIGARVRGARSMRGLTRRDLAVRLGVSEQTVEKYERGEARIMASRIWQISQILDAPASFFYDEFSDRGPRSMTDELLKAMTAENMSVLRSLDLLTKGQRVMVLRMIEELRGANREAVRTDPAGAETV